MGPKDVEKGTVAVSRRDKPGKEGKAFISSDSIGKQIDSLLVEIQKAMLERARVFRDTNIHDPKDYEDLKKIVENGWAFAYWCGDASCETKIKEDTKATTRCIPLEQDFPEGKCIVCGKNAKEKAYFAKAY